MELRYSFGDAKNYPALTVPVLSADRVVISDVALPLPLDTDARAKMYRCPQMFLRTFKEFVACSIS
eukprot:2292687-Amphidinium_carterae.1